MRKEFNDTGVCVPDRHYMVDITAKMAQIAQLSDYMKRLPSKTKRSLPSG